MRPIVVFGGTGFIGRHLVAALVSNGHRVIVASRTTASISDASANPRPMRADVSDRAGVDAVVAGAGIVFNLASGGGSEWSDFERDFIRGARNVAESCLAHGVRRLIYTSSSAALYLAGTRPLDERDGVDAKPETRAAYARAKIEAERVLLDLHGERGLPVVIVRPAVVVGEGGLLAHSALGSWPSPTCCIGRGRGDSPIPFVLVRDVVQALIAAIDSPGVEGMSFNLAGDVRLSASGYVAALARRLGRDFRFRPKRLPSLFAHDLVKWALKAAGGKKENPFPSWRDLASRTLSRPIDNRLAKRHLAWIPVNDLQTFLDEAIGPHVRPMLPGDLRA